MTEPLTPKAFFEERLPELAERFRKALGPASGELRQGATLELAARLTGEGGGSWRLCLSREGLEVKPGARDAAVLSFSTEFQDWHGALFEGRGGPVGRAARRLLEPDAAFPPALIDWFSQQIPGLAAASGSALALEGSVELMLLDGEEVDWALVIAFGPLPPEGEDPSVTIEVATEDADAIAEGRLDPVQAFMAGRVQFVGDISLLLKLQAIQMSAQSAEEAPEDPDGE